MKALRTKLSTYAIALLLSCGFSNVSWSGSSDFSGIFGAMYGSAGGAQISGTHKDQSGAETKGQVGGVLPIGGYELGFNLPVGDVFFLGVGHSWTQSGTVTIAEGIDRGIKDPGSPQTGEDAGADASYHLKAKNLKSVYLMPSISIYDNSALYVKLGRSIADMELHGSASGTPNNLTGDTWGVGTIAMTNSGLFIKTEGTYTQFDDILVVGVGGSGSALVEGNPDVVAGTVAIGFKF